MYVDDIQMHGSYISLKTITLKSLTSQLKVVRKPLEYKHMTLIVKIYSAVAITITFITVCGQTKETTRACMLVIPPGYN